MKKIILGSLFVASSLFAGDVLAVVNGEKITKTEVNDVLKQQNITYDKLPEQYKRQILDRIITDALLIQKAENSGVEKTKTYKEELQKLKKQLALKVFLKNKIDSFKVSDAEIKAFYDKNKDMMFKQPAEVKARHILVKTKAEAEKLINELKNVPQNKLEAKFIELAKKYSTGPSGKNGGELGWFTKDRMIAPFSKAAFSMKKGTITLQPVKTRFGWHIIYVEDKKAGGYVPFNQVKDKIKQQLQLKKLQDYVKTIKDSANIQYK
jgi:parvulin-like peptidyl-prolyl isomerase